MARNPERQRATEARYRARHPERIAAKSKRAQRKRRALLAQLKSQPCMDCGQSYPPYVMDFDHRRGTKVFDVSTNSMWGLQAVLTEIEKCDLVCANCHRIRTYKETYQYGN